MKNVASKKKSKVVTRWYGCALWEKFLQPIMLILYRNFKEKSSSCCIFVLQKIIVYFSRSKKILGRFLLLLELFTAIMTDRQLFFLNGHKDIIKCESHYQKQWKRVKMPSSNEIYVLTLTVFHLTMHFFLSCGSK